MKKIISSIIVFLFCLQTSNSLAEEVDIPAKSVIAYEVSTGKILYEKNSKKAIPIASLTKALTAYLVYKEVKSGKLSWDTPVTISDYPYQLTTNYTISNVPLDARQYTVKELLDAMLVSNANSPAIALAEKISGTEPLFVDLMNKQLKEWGITSSKLVNATGLPNDILGDNIYPKSKKSAENMFSAHDLALISRHLLTEFPQILKVTALPQDTFAGQSIFSNNYMLKGMPNYRDGVDGLFTGYSEKGGASFMASSLEGNMQVVTIVLGAKETSKGDSQQFSTTNTLLEYILKAFHKVTVFKKGQEIPSKKLSVLDSPESKVELYAKKDFQVIQRLDQKDEGKFDIAETQKQLVAPIEKHKKVATLTYKENQTIGSAYLNEPPKLELVTGKKIPKSFFLKVWWNHIVDYVNKNL